ELTLEHIMPESLGGTLKLPQSSCKECQKFTGAYEGLSARRLFLPIRRQFQFPSKSRGRARREERESETFTVIIDGKKRHIPAKDYPGLLVSFASDYPTVLQGLLPTNRSFAGRVTLGKLPDFDARQSALLAAYGGREVTYPTHGSAEAVGRLLAKIGYACAVAELGIDAFSPYLLGIIRGGDECLLHHVGGSALEIAPVGEDLHEIELLAPGTLAPHNLVVVKIRLFANYAGMPTHYVVVGEKKP